GSLVGGLTLCFVAAAAFLRGFRRGRYRQPNSARQRLARIFRRTRALRHLVNQSAAGTLREDQLVLNPVDVDVHEIAQSDLARRHQVRKWINKESLNRSLQVTSAVLVIQTFL